MPALQIRTAAPGAGLVADRARRTITGQVVPWGVYARVSTGQTVAFARGSLALSDRAKLVLDHDPTQPVAVYVSATDTPAGLEATFRVPAGERGDQILAEAGDLRDGLSVGADIDAATEGDAGLWVTAARGRHVALLSEPAFDTARVSVVTAAPPTQGVPTVPDAPAPAAPPAPVAAAPPAVPAPAPVVSGSPDATPPAPPAPVEIPTLAGVAAASHPGAPAVVRDPYPYAIPCEAGGPSFVRDAFASLENPGSAEADRWRRAQNMAADPAALRSGMARMAAPGASLRAAGEGTTTGDPGLVPDRWLPGRFVPLRGAKAPLYTVLTKYPTPDFSTLMVPRTTSEAGLSGTGADELTPLPPGTIGTDADAVPIEEVEGSYRFSRKLLMGSNPSIDRIALDALDRAWLADVEARAVAYFTTPANSTAWGSTYADGIGYIASLRALFAAMAAGTLYTSTDAIPAAKEYEAAAAADDTTERPLLPYGNSINSAGASAEAYAALEVQGVPLWPGPYMPANKTLVLDQSVSAASAFVTPVMNFRLEWTGDGNVKVLQLTKYSGVGFWSQYPGGVHVVTNTTPIAAGANGGGGNGGAGGTGKSKAA
jgi:hypothetical protein